MVKLCTLKKKFTGELGLQNCDICMYVVNKQFELLEFVFNSIYVDLKNNEIYFTFTAGYVCLCGVCSHVVVLGLSVYEVVLGAVMSVCVASLRSQENLSIFAFCVRRCGSGCHNSVLAVQARWDLFYGGHLVLPSHPISLLVQVPRGVCVIQ